MQIAAAIAAAFTTYFCMYAFRKPIGAATFEGLRVFGIDLKIAVLSSQLLGYATAKFLGIRVLSEMSPARRTATLLGVVLAAEACLAIFAIVPAPLRLVAMFGNGLCLGGVWGLVYAYLEGRRTSEILGAGLSASYIVASGVVKTVGRKIVLLGVPEVWMPAVTGLTFLPLFLVGVAGLAALPPPSPDDEALRTRRTPMDRRARRAFVRRHAMPIAALTGLYVLLTAYRDIRDNFAVEIWNALGWAGKPQILTVSEIPIALAVLLVLAVLYRVEDNLRALYWVHGIMACGTVLIGLATLGFDLGLVGGTAFMILVGLGLYLAYVPYGCVLFDRMIAATGTVGTAVFMIYVTDAAGYAGSIALMLGKHAFGPDTPWLHFFRLISYATCALCTAAFAASAIGISRVVRGPAVVPSEP
ncbi:MAG: hypothetical protein D6705_10345 [Deltaproteobacteria bacterium]|nr:MAG: hypothetical protein D6705_10345 [Deltaproteobacteria bacterium]